jgi:hypothetical protein
VDHLTGFVEAKLKKRLSLFFTHMPETTPRQPSHTMRSPTSRVKETPGEVQKAWERMEQKAFEQAKGALETKGVSVTSELSAV